MWKKKQTTPVVMALLALLVWFACNRNGENNVKRSTSEPTTKAVPLGGIERFDAILNKSLVFPDPDEQGRYDEIPRSREGVRRAYGYSLRMQPGMVLNRHFQLITVTIAPLRIGMHDAGTGLTGTAGPNGGFFTATATTGDGVYEVVVSIGASLPNTVSVRELDPLELAAKVAAAYDSRP